VIPTPEQARQLVDHFGGIRPTGRALGIPYETVRFWVRPEPQRKSNREWFHNLSGPDYHQRLLYMRRVKALRRKAERNERLKGGDQIGAL
jgi:hypothetical protein